MKKIVRLLIGSGENCADIRYAAGISTPDDFIYFASDEEKCVVMSALEIARARATVKPGVTVLAESELNGPNRLNILRSIAERCGAEDFVVPEDFPLGIADQMREAGLSVHADKERFFPEREFKSPAEVAAITAAQRGAEAGLARAMDILKRSSISGDFIQWNGAVLTSETLRAEIDCEILRAGMLPTGTICAGGTQGSQPHNTGSGPLRANAPIVMDIFPRSPETGYWGDLTRTVVKGRAEAAARRAYEAVLDAREYAKTLLRPGVCGAEIHCAAEAVLERHGFLTGTDENGPFGFFHGLGHGVGLEIHENPRLSPRARTKLGGGEVVTVEPGLYYREWGGIRLEDLMYLGPDGPVCLTDAPDIPELP